MYTNIPNFGALVKGGGDEFFVCAYLGRIK